MHQALYRKWRPDNFDDVYGQEHITSILKYETENLKFSHAYLFCGSRGTGKTTCAKILSRAVNCLSPIGGNPCNKCASCLEIAAGSATDVLEMDAASNNGVDNIRDIREEVVYTPSTLKYRVYIIDEVHMLSSNAFNALLKTLEEPPAHVIFILATTELHKLPATIISRCKRFEFRRIQTTIIMDRLKMVAETEGYEYEEGALRIISKYSQGGMRDALSLLELCAGNIGKVTEESVRESVGMGSRDNILATVTAISEGNYSILFETVDRIVRSSVDISVFFNDLVVFYRDMLVIKTVKEGEKYLDLTDNETETLRSVCDGFTREKIIRHSRVLEETIAAFWRTPAIKKTTAELALVKMCDEKLDLSYDALLERIAGLEAGIYTGAVKTVHPKKAEEKKTVPVSENSTVNKKYISEFNTDLRITQIRSWPDIVENCGAFSEPYKSFLKSAKVYLSGENTVSVCIDNGFYYDMLQKEPDISINIARAVSAELKKNISAENIKFEVREMNEDIPDDLADFV